jgi:hypothetical protein
LKEDQAKIILEGIKMDIPYSESILILYQMEYMTGLLFRNIQQRTQPYISLKPLVTDKYRDDIAAFREHSHTILGDILKRLAELPEFSREYTPDKSHDFPQGDTALSSEASNTQVNTQHHHLLAFYQHNINRIAPETTFNDPLLLFKHYILATLVSLQKLALQARKCIEHRQSSTKKNITQKVGANKYRLIQAKPDAVLHNTQPCQKARVQKKSTRPNKLFTLLQFSQGQLRALQNHLTQYINYRDWVMKAIAEQSMREQNPECLETPVEVPPTQPDQPVDQSLESEENLQFKSPAFPTGEQEYWRSLIQGIQQKSAPVTVIDMTAHEPEHPHGHSPIYCSK